MFEDVLKKSESDIFRDILMRMMKIKNALGIPWTCVIEPKQKLENWEIEIMKDFPDIEIKEEK